MHREKRFGLVAKIRQKGPWKVFDSWTKYITYVVYKYLSQGIQEWTK